MYNLPRIVKRFLHTTYYLLHTTSQRGFAPIALVVFMLVGIAAATLLVQNGVNFLPKAASTTSFDGTFDCQSADLVSVKWGKCAISCRQVRCSTTEGQKDAKCGNAAADQCIIRSSDGVPANACEGIGSDLCVKDATEGKVTNTICGSIRGQAGKGVVDSSYLKVFYDDCNGGILTCNNYKTPANEPIASCRTAPTGATLVSAAAPPAAQYSDTPDPWDSDDDGVIRIRYNQKCTSDGKRIFIVKKGKTITQDSRKDSGGSPQCDIAGRPCDPGLKPVCDTNKLQCEVTVAGFEAKCVSAGAAPAAGTPQDVPAKACKKEDADSCKKKFNNDCYEIDGKSRCVLPAGTSKCSDEEDAFCKTPPDPRDGCDIIPVNILKDQTKVPILYSRCKAAKANTSGPAAPAAAPAQPGQPTAGRPATPGQPAAAPAARTAAPLECGFDKDGLTIPCYQIGVFKNLDDLIATEAQAKVNVERYKGYRTILEQVQKDVDGKILDAASAKLAEAEKAAKACIDQK